ncbi:RHS repeat-associated core domain-containing protein [Pseudomonas sp. G(2018)]|uniref:RHS repeat-associated core domain-containing protein n=1 Tax=Pseudomonas sp. G(2018) TaxID=2502242 RepID=UPI0010F7EE20|nr:RHS repeat-associated core domain-containing protein [Pseudomonas sp. G(2018)]
MTQPKKQNPTGQHTVLLAVDFKNSVLAEIDAGRTNRIAYSPYGRQSAQHELITRLGFNGELREEKLDWYVLGNGYRVYNPWLMRFHSPDSLSPFGRGGRNAYIYCGGEPMMNTDPTGHYFGLPLSIARTFIDDLIAIPTRMASAAKTAVSQSVKTVSSGISRVTNQAKQTLDDAFSSVIARSTTETEFAKIPRVTASNRKAISPTMLSENSFQTHGYANRTILPSTQPKPQNHGYANRTALPSTRPKPQNHGYANRTALPSTRPKPQNHGYANRTEILNWNSTSSSTTAVNKIRT